MKNIFYLLALFTLVSCGGSEESSTEEETSLDTVYQNDDTMILNAKALKDKLAQFQSSFTAIGDKEVEETICTESSTVPYNGSSEVMEIWTITTYLLNNFSTEDFGKYDFKMPNVNIRDSIPLSELNWLNFNRDDTTTFDIYKSYPDLTDVSKSDEDIQNVEKANEIFNALESGLLCVIAITEYVPPVLNSGTDYETGYVMGYLMFADWDTGELSCLSPLLAQNREQLDFGDEDAMKTLNIDLKDQTYAVIDSVARLRTGFEGNSSQIRMF